MPAILIVAGEPSGDLQASRVATQLKTLRPDIELFGMGGDRMEAAGVSLVYHIRDSAVMGIGEVLSAIPAFLKKQRYLKRLIREKRPDAVVLVDFAEFNMGLAAYAQRLKIPIVYYIPPKAWAWRGYRAKKIAKRTSAVASIFPFETDFYRRAGAHVRFVGHPLLDYANSDLGVSEAREKLELATDAPVLGLMPGSRRREVEALYPAMMDAAERVRRILPDCQLILPLAPSIPPETLPKAPTVQIVKDATYDAMRASDLILVASGTATLEAACLLTPMVVLYRLSRLSWWTAQRFVKLDSSALPNIVAGRRIVPELLQDEVEVERLTSVALGLLQDPEKRKAQQVALCKVREQLGGSGAAERTAELVLGYVES
ncbi:MAG: lipid-A-disaccharide synthase [Candidatus Poribacteria bacterium]|nr:lipid-A-disaccharide synthase [Candidatus Poribacteria bacterium]MDE0503539.1 lipid-A-disaccharide synthase [Candidatus Poribacteria bacterium]